MSKSNQSSEENLEQSQSVSTGTSKMSTQAQKQKEWNEGSSERKKIVGKAAATAGLAAGLKMALVSVPTVGLLNQFYLPFKRRTAVSAKVALAIMPPVFVFAFFSDHMTSRLANPDGFDTFVKKEKTGINLPIHKKFANHVYEHPFQTIIFTAIPTVSAIFFTRKGEHMKFSQRVMHTRVMGQASVLMILLGTFAFHDWMDKRGGAFE